MPVITLSPFQCIYYIRPESSRQGVGAGLASSNFAGIELVSVCACIGLLGVEGCVKISVDARLV